MAIGPRLDLRQSQSLVMTPQLRQAIKLLQFSNVEAAAFVEEELERNPLLERDDGIEFSPIERPALDQLGAGLTGAETRPAGGDEYADAHVPDTADLTRSDTLSAEGSSPLDTAEYAEPYDPGGASDGAFSGGSGGSQSFEADDRSIDDFAEAAATLREHLGEQLRLSFNDPVERLIGTYLIALLEPSGRLSVELRSAGHRHGRRTGDRRGGAGADDALRPDRHVRP